MKSAIEINYNSIIMQILKFAYMYGNKKGNKLPNTTCRLAFEISIFIISFLVLWPALLFKYIVLKQKRDKSEFINDTTDICLPVMLFVWIVIFGFTSMPLMDFIDFESFHKFLLLYLPYLVVFIIWAICILIKWMKKVFKCLSFFLCRKIEFKNI